MSTPAGRLPAPTTLHFLLPQVGTTWLAAALELTLRKLLHQLAALAQRLGRACVTKIPEGVWFLAGYGSFPPLRCIPDTVNGAKTIRELYDKAGDTFGKANQVHCWVAALDAYRSCLSLTPNRNKPSLCCSCSGCTLSKNMALVSWQQCAHARRPLLKPECWRAHASACSSSASSPAGKYTVPVLWDKKEGTIVNNESSEIVRMFNSSFNELAKKPDLDLCALQRPCSDVASMCSKCRYSMHGKSAG